ncbi:unnamed protein product [Somion occarium]|uniref:Uncharacterized protein n=2 Tax=Somion occarium TaxID=3059160 RepID=A0ABP1D5N7_9APHY
MLPLTLIYLLQQILGGNAQQSSFQLPLNNLSNFTGTTLPNPAVLSIPSSQSSNFTITVALCSSSPQIPRFILSNDTSITQPSQPDLDTPNVFEVSLNNGYGNWTGLMPNGGFMSVLNAGQTPFEVGVSDGGPMHEIMDSYPFLGDTTSNQALLFSPAFGEASTSNPTYPNYTLPAANLSFPQGPSSPPNFTLIIVPTSSSSLASVPRTACAMSSVRAADVLHEGPAESEGLWLKDQAGWRWQWLVNGLTPATNYTVYAMQDNSKVSSPINFVTKSASFDCPIVHSLPFCPSISYAVPIQGPSLPASAHDTTTLPEEFYSPLLEVLTNFTVSLTTFPCGRDMYSPIVGCADCQQAYRRWLCAIWFPRCSEAAPDSGDSTQKPLSALQAQAPSATPRSPSLPPFPSGYNALLPCLETCTAVDRACPISLGFKCPIPRFTAKASYGVGYIDTGEEGDEGGGLTGTAQDRWGNVWCNLG